MKMRTRARLPYTATALLLLLSMASFLVACGGGSQTTSTTGGSAGFKTYTDSAYGFSFVYPADWTLKSNGDAQATAGASAKYSLGVFNPKGTVAQGSYIDVMAVQLYKLNAAVTDSAKVLLKPEIDKVYSDLQQQNGWTAVDELSDVSLGDLWGWRRTFSFDIKGVPSHTTFYALFHGDLEYQLVVQAPTKSWDGYSSIFDTFVKSFRVGAT